MWEGAGVDSEWLFPQVCACPTREEVTNGWGVTCKSSLIIHLSKGLGRESCFEEWGTDGHQSKREMHTPIPKHPTYAHKKDLYFRLARHLGAHHMPLWLTTCSLGPCEEEHTNTYASAHKSLLFYNYSTFPTANTFLHTDVTCVYVGCEDRNLPADRNTWWSVFTYTLSHISAHIPKVKYRKQSQQGTHTHRRGCDVEHKLSIHHCVKLPIITTAFPLLPFHIWLSPIQTVNQPLKCNDATPTVTTKKSLASCRL